MCVRVADVLKPCFFYRVEPLDELDMPEFFAVESELSELDRYTD